MQDPPRTSAPVQSEASPSSTRIALIDQQDHCSLFEQGYVLDLGSDASESMRGFSLLPDPASEFEGLMGESFRKLDQLSNDFSFWLPEEGKGYALQALISGRESQRVAAYLDGQRLGAAKLSSGEVRVVSVGRPTDWKPGLHTLRISLSRRQGSTPGADVSWLRLGRPNWRAEDHPATRRQVFSEVTIEEARHRAVILSPGGRARCPLRLPENARLETQMGLWGNGAAEGEIALLVEGEPRLVLGGERREKEDFRTFAPMSFDLSQFGGRFAEIEFVAHPHGGSARVAFANPLVVTKPRKTEQTPQARRAVLIILGGLQERHAPPQAGENGLPFLNQFQKTAVSVPHYRATSTSVPGVVASLLTATPPVRHGLSRLTDQLSPGLRTLSSAVEASGGRSGFFTGVPLSFRNFGFDRGFERFEAIFPQEDEPTEKPLLDATEWLVASKDHEGPVLAVVHLRGAHPPFDVPREEARKLAPAEYGGDLSPRRAAIQLGDIRNRRLSRHRRMPREDWTRLASLQKEALLKQSAALTQFVAELRNQELYEDTLLVVMGDVAAGERPRIPYAPDAPLEESFLAVPLLVKFAEQSRRGTTLPGRFAPRDVSYTVSESLGVDWLSEGDAIDLGRSDATERSDLRPHIAFRDHHYALRWGKYLLSGADGRPPQLCQPEVDPTCTTDRAEQRPTITRTLWLTAFGNLSSGLANAAPSVEQEPDEHFENALIVWGVAR